VEKLGKSIQNQALKEEFDGLNRRALSRMKDKTLAEWQAKYPPESPQFILAQYEWNRRLTADQNKIIWTVLIGVILGYLLKVLDGLILR
jgi:hypothetical protein